MLLAKLYKNEEYLGTYNIEIGFNIEDNISYLNIELEDTLHDTNISNIIDRVFTKNNMHLSIDVALNSVCTLHTDNLFIRNVNRNVTSFKIEGFSTKYIFKNIEEDKRMYEKIIKDIEEDDYRLFNTSIREFDTYRILELSYAKDNDKQVELTK